jgi:2-oxo-4-hydroxy-4-carboxy--5-ureidoimidazoline (OHCU) decarboxylase
VWLYTSIGRLNHQWQLSFIFNETTTTMATSEITTLPPIDSIPDAPDFARHTVLALLFEPSPSLYLKADPILTTTPFASYHHLIQAIGTELQCLAASTKPNDLESLNDILGSHPRLGEKKVESAMSRMEQAAMQKASEASSAASGGSEALEEEQATLKVLNRLYESTFPGMRYV